ncbi:amidohydrolase [Cognatishimia maritima]|uniref:Amidohydrolase n=1 Tax=Cognatishimia maritima TaxID=870908 RepID=A0A1M5NIH0_9RHOB|nr:amidohydrolase [Cognatishimia maritima]SHG89009.1 amidohydrolase [Cognatishimia maritima]
MLTNSDLMELTELRRALHRRPEVSGQEQETAETVRRALNALSPTQIITGLGGHGVAAVFDSGLDGPTVLFRAELDGLPIQEISEKAWRSEIAGQGHLCGHDGHMTMLLALGRLLRRKPVAKGRVVLLFQPAEEDGSGARAVVADPRFADIQPDWAFAIHNLPGIPLGQLATRPGLMNCASRGLRIHLTGKTAHAAMPEDGTSPMQAISELIPALTALGQGGALDDSFQLVTLTHLSVGAPSFGISPGEAHLFATLRTAEDTAMAGLADQANTILEDAAKRHGLGLEVEVFDDFAASINDTEATEIALKAAGTLDIPSTNAGIPMRASEDFGVFGWSAKSAMLCLGAGETHAALHNPDYDFPDDLIPVGAALFHQIARDLLGPT